MQNCARIYTFATSINRTPNDRFVYKSEVLDGDNLPGATIMSCWGIQHLSLFITISRLISQTKNGSAND
ncbi:MAG: hypothetical protein JEZ14_00605 [Marinilabiliaceae bacterium]|nr:hypothetical protein [Marinilabiliaceae bacterium]